MFLWEKVFSWRQYLHPKQKNNLTNKLQILKTTQKLLSKTVVKKDPPPLMNKVHIFTAPFLGQSQTFWHINPMINHWRNMSGGRWKGLNYCNGCWQSKPNEETLYMNNYSVVFISKPHHLTIRSLMTPYVLFFSKCLSYQPMTGCLNQGLDS